MITALGFLAFLWVISHLKDIFIFLIILAVVAIFIAIIYKITNDHFVEQYREDHPGTPLTDEEIKKKLRLREFSEDEQADINEMVDVYISKLYDSSNVWLQSVDYDKSAEEQENDSCIYLVYNDYMDDRQIDAYYVKSISKHKNKFFYKSDFCDAVKFEVKERLAQSKAEK